MDRQRLHIEDELLVMDARDGDAGAMDKLVMRWQKRLWRHALRLTGDTDAAWDVTQQSWMGIIKGLPKLHDPANFKAWAYRITTNKSIDWIKKHKSSKTAPAEDIPAKQVPCEKDTGIKELLAKLDTKKKAVLSLYYFEELSVAEIGIALNIATGTVKSRLHNGRKELKQLWDQYCE